MVRLRARDISQLASADAELRGITAWEDIARDTVSFGWPGVLVAAVSRRDNPFPLVRRTVRMVFEKRDSFAHQAQLENESGEA